MESEVSLKIREWVEAHRGDYLRDVSDLVAIRSVSGEAAPGAPFGEGPAKALAEAGRIAEKLGLSVHNVDGYVLTADLPGESRALDILAHLDIVAEGEGWETDPYAAVEKEGCLYGRGTDDDKGPAVAALYAMTCVKELFGDQLKHGARVILGTDEESGSGDIAYYYQKEKPAPNTFSPDASFPVYNTEKGGFTGHFSVKWPRSEELPRLRSLHGGFRINVLPADAEAEIEGLPLTEIESICRPLAAVLGVSVFITERDGIVTVHTRGAGTHASTPELGVNGLTALLRLLLALPLSEGPAVQALRSLDRLLPHGDSAGKHLGIAMGDEVSGDLTLAFDLLTVTETGLEGFFDSRVPLCAGKENCFDKAKAAFEQAGFRFEAHVRPPHHTPGDSEFVKTLLSVYERVTGRKGECLSMGGGTYVHGIPGAVAFGAGMPGFESNLHSPNERMHIDSMLQAIRIFAEVIWRLCC